MKDPKTYLYSKDHEWLEKNDDQSVTIGISDFAQKSLGDVTYVDLPDVGTQLNKGESFGSVESVKAVSDLYAPITGEIIAINEKINDEPEIVNSTPYDQGWMIKVKCVDLDQQCSELMSFEAYQDIAQ